MSEPKVAASTLVAFATAQLAASPHLRDSAAHDAVILLLHSLGITRVQFHANPDRPVPPEQQAAYKSAVTRRLVHEPIQYIIGEQEFYGLALRVTPAVLIPRPETEHLVEAVIEELTRNGVLPTEAKPSRGTPILRILDIGTGSGAIAIALAHHLPSARVTATDISHAALAIARENAAHHNVADRISFFESDLLDSIGLEQDIHAARTREPHRERYEAVVCNPPYVPEADSAALHPQVRDHEPASALFAGDDGLAIYRRLIPQVNSVLAPNGLLALEIGHGQQEAIKQLLADWDAVRFICDLQNIPRVVLARKPPGI